MKVYVDMIDSGELVCFHINNDGSYGMINSSVKTRPLNLVAIQLNAYVYPEDLRYEKLVEKPVCLNYIQLWLLTKLYTSEQMEHLEFLQKLTKI